MRTISSWKTTLVKGNRFGFLLNNNFRKRERERDRINEQKKINKKTNPKPAHAFKRVDTSKLYTLRVSAYAFVFMFVCVCVCD